MEKRKVIEQTKLAFEFIQKLYHEAAYLIREIELQIAEVDEEFIIVRPTGYSITSRNSTGLEPNNVARWPIRKFSVIFVPRDTTAISGTTLTSLSEQTKVIYIRIILDDAEIKEPLIVFGVFYDFKDIQQKRLNKIEQLLSHIEYRENAVFKKQNTIDYEDGYVKFRAKLHRENLYDLSNSQDVNALIVLPALKMYRGLVYKPEL